MARYWRHCADDTLAEATAADQREAAYLNASVTWAGMVRLDGLLDPETGEAVLAAVDAATPPPVAGDERPASNRRVEAVGSICEQWLRNGTTDGGLRATVTLTVDLETLQGRHGDNCELDHTGPITTETARRILCDADITASSPGATLRSSTSATPPGSPPPALAQGAPPARPALPIPMDANAPPTGATPTTSPPGSEDESPRFLGQPDPAVPPPSHNGPRTPGHHHRRRTHARSPRTRRPVRPVT